MRVHGDKIICRRSNVPHQSDCQKYKTDIRTDFQNICGYCGKHEMVTHKNMELDHFVPENIDPIRKSDYSNLVYSCFTCNRKKLGKWPTGDGRRPHNEYEGFVDPATSDYDKHLGRKEDGELEYYTEVGKYMHKTAFKFDIRPTKEIWKASKLCERIEKLGRSENRISSVKKSECAEVLLDLFNLQKYLFEKNE